MFMKTATYTSKLSLALPVAGGDVSAGRAGLAGVLRRDGDHLPAAPSLLVLKLTPELKPALIEDGLVKPSFGPNIPARSLHVSLCRCTHVLHPQVFQHNNRVVFADRGAGLVQVVIPCVGNLDVDPGNFGLLLLPVGREFHLTSQAALSNSQTLSLTLEAVQRFKERTVAKGSEPSNAEIDPHGGSGRMHRLSNLHFRLDREIPVLAPARYRDVAGYALDIPALDEPDPADLRKIHPVSIQLEPLGIPERVSGATLFLEYRELLWVLLVKSLHESMVEEFQGLLQSLRRCFGEEGGFFLAFPTGKQLRHFDITQHLLPGIEAFLLRGKGLVPEKAATPCLLLENGFLIRLGL